MPRSRQTILVCSSSPGEGKSTITLNLAYMAARAGLKTLVIDADLRRGSVGHHLGFDDTTPGFADLLRSGGSWRDYVRPARDYGFAAMTRGTDSIGAVNALFRGIPEGLMTETKAEYDLLLIDSAPIVPVADTIPFLTLADRLVFVVKIRGASLAAAQRAFAIIRRSTSKTPLIVANGTSPTESNYYYAQTRA